MRFFKRELTKAYTLFSVRREFREQQRIQELQKKRLRAPRPSAEPVPK